MVNQKKISGGFFLVVDEQINTASPLYPQVRKFHIRPEFDENDKQVGTFDLNIDFSVGESDTERKLKGGFCKVVAALIGKTEKQALSVSCQK